MIIYLNLQIQREDGYKINTIKRDGFPAYISLISYYELGFREVSHYNNYEQATLGHLWLTKASIEILDNLPTKKLDI